MLEFLYCKAFIKGNKKWVPVMCKPFRHLRIHSERFSNFYQKIKRCFLKYLDSRNYLFCLLLFFRGRDRNDNILNNYFFLENGENVYFEDFLENNDHHAPLLSLLPWQLFQTASVVYFFIKTYI